MKLAVCALVAVVGACEDHDHLVVSPLAEWTELRLTIHAGSGTGGGSPFLVELAQAGEDTSEVCRTLTADFTATFVEMPMMVERGFVDLASDSHQCTTPEAYVFRAVPAMGALVLADSSRTVSCDLSAVTATTTELDCGGVTNTFRR